MSQRRFVLVLAAALTAAYVIASVLIGRAGKTKLSFGDWETADLIGAIEGYDFTGVWHERSGRPGSALGRFQSSNGTAHLQVRCEAADYAAFSFANITFEPSSAFWLNILLTDGFSAFTSNKFLMRVKVPGSKRGQTDYGVRFRAATGIRGLGPQGGLNLTLSLNTERVRKTGLLEDLDLQVGLLSDEQESEMDLVLRLKYNNYFNTQGVFRFLSFGFLIGIFESVLLLLAMSHLDRRENLCREQSVAFWTALGMFNCLFCFVHITDSTEHSQNLSYFLVNSLLNFLNFGLVVLRVLHRIGKVQLGSVLANSVSL